MYYTYWKNEPILQTDLTTSRLQFDNKSYFYSQNNGLRVLSGSFVGQACFKDWLF